MIFKEFVILVNNKKVLVVGFGNQGKKRTLLLKSRLYATVDPFDHNSDFKNFESIDHNLYSHVFICTPEDYKLKFVKEFLKRGKNVLVEKPFLINQNQFNTLLKIQKKYSSNLYVAFNHRFEPAIKELEFALNSNKKNRIYGVEILYSNGTARLVKKSKWKDKGSGVINDLLSHQLNMFQFWFPKHKININSVKAWRNENLSPDRAIVDLELRRKNSIIPIRCEINLLSWKNEFRVKVYGSEENMMIQDFCKWGASRFEKHKRKLPSGIPKKIFKEWKSVDPTWKLEEKYFLNINRKLSITNQLENLEVSKILNKIEKLIG